MSYHHITQEQRTELGVLLRVKTKKQDIAKQLNKHRSSIWREMHRNKANTNTGYHAEIARSQTKMRRLTANSHFRKIDSSKELQKYIYKRLRATWTPEQIAGTLREEFGFTVLCHQTIYQYIYKVKPKWIQYLRHKKNRFRRRHGTAGRLQILADSKKKRIDQRPLLIEERTRIGDWEGDTVVGKEKTKRILTYVERKSGLLKAVKLESATANEVREKTRLLFQKLNINKRHSITYDNGSEFADYEWIEKDLKLDTYFAYPYHSWERGTNENTNGLLRQFFPKGTSFANITQKEIDRAVKLINTRPRKRHKYKTPEDIFYERCTLD